jgi:hypothetical protein
MCWMRTVATLYCKVLSTAKANAVVLAGQRGLDINAATALLR